MTVRHTFKHTHTHTHTLTLIYKHSAEKLREDSEITRIFGGQLRTQLVCPDCAKTTVYFEYHRSVRALTSSPLVTIGLWDRICFLKKFLKLVFLYINFPSYFFETFMTLNHICMIVFILSLFVSVSLSICLSLSHTHTLSLSLCFSLCPSLLSLYISLCLSLFVCLSHCITVSLFHLDPRLMRISPRTDCFVYNIHFLVRIHLFKMIQLSPN